MIAHFHYFSDREKILKLSRSKDRLHYKGTPMHIFPVMSPDVGKLRAAFNPVKAKLRDAGINYNLYCPARLAITIEGSRYTFDNLQNGEKFMEKKVHTSTEKDE